MKPEEIIAIHERYVGPGFGTTTPDELVFIQDLIKQHRPKRFLEIGTASGFSTGVIARMLEAHGGRAITSIDLDTQFFGDTDKESGFLARAIYQGDKVEIKLHTKVTAFDLEALGGPWDMAFVDANHQHPWPVLDTLALAPHLNNSRIVIHHDLQLFRRFKAFRGVGPRLLFNEVPDAYRQASAANGWNIFALDLNMPPDIFEEVAKNALSLPWTDRPPIRSHMLKRIEAWLRAEYGEDLASEFQAAARVYRMSLPGWLYFLLRHRVALLRARLRR